MKWINRMVDSYQGGQYRRQPESTSKASIQGTIQRVEYQRRELRVIAQGQVWRFVVADNCRLSFNSTPTILRCFHPLDPVTVIFRSEGTEHMAVAIFSVERKQPC